MKSILITGCNGLIGESLIEQLRLEGSFNIYGIGRSKKNLANTIEIDLSGNWSENELPKDIEIVIHLAQSELFRDFPDSAQNVFNVNTVSTLKLLDYARRIGVKKFIYASSGGVYGNSDIGFSEDSPLQPNKDLGFYLSTKFSSELLVGNYTNYFDVNILRFFFVYGPRQKENMLIPRLINSVRNGKIITLQGDEGIKINPIFIDDAVKAIATIMGRTGSYNVNIGGAETVSIKTISEIIGKGTGKVPIFEQQAGEVKNLIGDISRMRSFFSPTITLEEGIKRML